MINSSKILAIIPARGGSKGLPQKNIKELCGKPLIAWSIEQSKLCKDIDKTIVTTDDSRIMDIANQYGAEVPFVRPERLSDDTASTTEVIFHTMEWLKEHQGYQADYILLLQPTSPLRSIEDIKSVIRMTEENKFMAVVSVCETAHHPWWSNILPEDGNMKDFIRPDLLNKPRQSLPVFFRLNGAIYLSNKDYFYKYNGFFGPDTFAYKMPRSRSVDIDSILDFQLAELLLTGRIK
jgi:N-acylneuraminate cytidylyltransferase/CMP-N,N'-diacetyllegionaminic acid synthase